MANVDAVFSQIGQTLPSHDAVEYMGLIVNRKGYDRAIAAGARAITAVFACSDTLSQRNSRQSMSKAARYIVEVVQQARVDNIKSRVTLGVSWVCPTGCFDGVNPKLGRFVLVG